MKTWDQLAAITKQHGFKHPVPAVRKAANVGHYANKGHSDTDIGLLFGRGPAWAARYRRLAVALAA